MVFAGRPAVQHVSFYFQPVWQTFAVRAFARVWACVQDVVRDIGWTWARWPAPWLPCRPSMWMRSIGPTAHPMLC